MSEPRKLRVATASLAGCFGCHMSLLDIDERLEALLEIVDLDSSPLTDIEPGAPCDLGLVEGGLCNAENVHTLRALRARCAVLVAVGACAINGGLPAQRNHVSVRECLEAVYLRGEGVEGGVVPNDRELPLLLDKVRPLHDVVKIDYFLPGCPPSADAFWSFLTDLAAGREPVLHGALLRYD